MKRVKDIMATEVLSVKRGTTLAGLMNLFKNFHSFPLVPVIEKDGRLVGSVSLKNIIEVFNPPRPQLLKTIPFLDETEENIFEVDLDTEMGSFVIVEDIMDKDCLYVEDQSTIEKAYDQMNQYNCERLPVVNNDGVLCGLVGVFDIVRCLFQEKNII